MTIGRRIAKVPVLVGVCYGFVGNRMLHQRGVGGRWRGDADRVHAGQCQGLFKRGQSLWDTEEGGPLGCTVVSEPAGTTTV